MHTDDQTAIAIFLTAAASLFALSFWIWWKERAVLRWPQVAGKVLSSKSVRQVIRRRAIGPDQEEVIPAIVYEFDYQGRTVTTSHWRLGNFSIGCDPSTEVILSRYPEGSSVTVFVNVRNPMKSALEASSALCWVPFAFGLGCMVMAGFLALVVISKGTTNH